MGTECHGNWKLRYANRFFVTMNKDMIIVILLVLLTIVPSLTEAGDLHLIRIGTGGRTGVYYPIGKMIAQGLTSNESDRKFDNSGEKGVPGFIGVAQNSAGSIDNVREVTAGEIEAGLVQADVAAWAYQGEGVFKGDEQVRTVRAIASLYPEKFQIVVRRDAKIHKFADLRGKRISIDEIGSGTLAVMRTALGAHQMTENDLLPVYLKPVFTHDKMIRGELQGFVMMAGAPMEAVNQLLNVGISLVPISPQVASKIEASYPYLVPGNIPANVYPGIPEISTIQVHALMVVNEAMDETLVYQITAALWSQRTLSMLKQGHPQGKSITPETALLGVSIPFHPGAKKYYQENSNRFKESQ